jgi:hypothetical protein
MGKKETLAEKTEQKEMMPELFTKNGSVATL